MRLTLILLSLWVVGGLLYGCNTPRKNALKPTGKTYLVEIKGMQLVPKIVEAAPGDTVKWVNKDIVAHNVTDDAPDGWKSKDLNTGEHFSIMVRGSASYKCTIHPIMTGKIKVKK